MGNNNNNNNKEDSGDHLLLILARILSRVLETNRDLLSLKLHRKIIY